MEGIVVRFGVWTKSLLREGERTNSWLRTLFVLATSSWTSDGAIDELRVIVSMCVAG